MSEPRPKRKGDWVGRYVRLRHDLETKGGTLFQAGDVLVVTRSFGGLWLSAPVACPLCRQSYRRSIKQVPEADVELLPAGYVPDLVKVYPAAAEPAAQILELVLQELDLEGWQARDLEQLQGRLQELLAHWRVQPLPPSPETTA